MSNSGSQAIAAVPAAWQLLTDAAQLARFSEIMRQMDDRYEGLDPARMEVWGERRRALGREPYVMGLTDASGEIRQVVAVSVRQRSGDNEDRRRIHMIGVDPQSFDEDGIDDETIGAWLGQTMTALAQQFGLPARFGTYRPKTMTWKPMQRMHDLMRAGMTVPVEGRKQELLRAEVDSEHDRGDAMFWTIRLSAIRDAAQHL